MVKAEEKRRDNIAEYIVYIYQSEDLIRSFEFDLDRINTYVISHIPLEKDAKKELLLWYASLIETMQKEKIESEGHLSETKELVNKLGQLHSDLTLHDEDYKKIVKSATPYIENQIKESEGGITSAVQVCLNAIYGFLLLKLSGKSVTNEQQAMLTIFGDMLSYLSYKYKQNSFLTSN
ncbi:MAG: DUF4924 family protein [Cyclobacteriaceae bacterium]|nr:DUF4924 family protein [Cyclobacteriaceae bacterium]